MQTGSCFSKIHYISANNHLSSEVAPRKLDMVKVMRSLLMTNHWLMIMKQNNQSSQCRPSEKPQPKKANQGREYCQVHVNFFVNKLLQVNYSNVTTEGKTVEIS